MSVDFNASFSGSAETFGAKMTETPASMTASMKETGGGSASNYEALRNKPKINGHELIGDMTPAQLGITDDRHHTHKQAQAAKGVDSRPQPRKAARPSRSSTVPALWSSGRSTTSTTTPCA